MSEDHKTLTCPECEGTFPYRSNKTFCSPTCRKAHSLKRGRQSNPANAKSSPTVRRDQHEAFELADRLAERLYTLPPSQRLGFAEEIVQRARDPKGSARLRRILTNPDLLRAAPDKKYLFYRRSPWSYPTISQAIDRYCRLMWGAGVTQVVRGTVPEPPTGELIAEVTPDLQGSDISAAYQ